MNLKIIYTTFDNEQNATDVAKLLLEKNLAACVNILPSAVSMYKWQDELINGSECLMIIKTTYEKFALSLKTLHSHHPYDTPCIISLNACLENTDFTNFLLKINSEG